MDYDINGLILNSSDVQRYLDSTVDKLYAVLGVYEDCMKQNEFENYSVYLKRLITELNGVYKLLGAEKFLSLVGVLRGMLDDIDMGHKSVKTMAFHCISIVKKAKRAV